MGSTCRICLDRILDEVPAPGHKALVLFDIDGTLLRRAGSHHREALAAAVKKVTGVEATTEGIPVAGMLDRDILTVMLRKSAPSPPLIRRARPRMAEHRHLPTFRRCPAL